eukprot:gene25973-biopygen12481
MNSCHEESVRDMSSSEIGPCYGEIDDMVQFLINSCREHSPRDMSASETGPCY